jgi:metallo-beta-lactamase class B
MFRRWFVFPALALSFFLVAPVFAQQPPEWREPFAPHRIAGNLYYVGSKDLAAFLIATPEGHILINSNLQSSVPQIKESVEKLGFHFSDIKILLISHAHFDHCAGSALIKELTGAKYMVMDADVPEVEDGGRSDFQYGKGPEFLYKPAKVDRILHDGDEVRLGGMVLTAHLTAGHTRGCTTWTFQVKDGDGKPDGKNKDGKNKDEKIYSVVIIGGPYVNPGYKLVHNAEYPQIAADYERTFTTLKGLPCDIFLGAHGSYYGMKEKYARIGQANNPFVDPAGYKAFVADREEAFRHELKEQER